MFIATFYVPDSDESETYFDDSSMGPLGDSVLMDNSLLASSSLPLALEGDEMEGSANSESRQAEVQADPPSAPLPSNAPVQPSAGDMNSQTGQTSQTSRDDVETDGVSLRHSPGPPGGGEGEEGGGVSVVLDGLDGEGNRESPQTSGNRSRGVWEEGREGGTPPDTGDSGMEGGEDEGEGMAESEGASNRVNENSNGEERLQEGGAVPRGSSEHTVEPEKEGRGSGEIESEADSVPSSRDGVQPTTSPTKKEPLGSNGVGGTDTPPDPDQGVGGDLVASSAHQPNLDKKEENDGAFPQVLRQFVCGYSSLAMCVCFPH